MSLEEKREFSLALVTGASSGIGEGLCRLLASKGIDLLMTGRDGDHLNRIAGELSSYVKVIVVQADLSKSEGCQKIIAAIHENIPDLIVNNAGCGLYGAALSHSTAAQLEILKINGQVLLELSLEAARTLISHDKKGVIMNIASSAAYHILPGMAVYGASKSFVNQFSQAFDCEVKPYGVRVLAACPGMVKTSFRERAGGGVEKKTFKFLEMTVPLVVEEIWMQIQKRQESRIIDWKYRLLAFLDRYFIPKKWSMKFTYNNIKNFSYDREIILLNSKDAEK